MDPMEKQKQLRWAMNGKMLLLFSGIFMIFSAVTSTVMYGINFFMIAQEAAKGTTEYVELLKNAETSIGLARGVGICFLAVGIWEVIVGFWVARNSNRVDKSDLTFKMVVSLLVLEVIMQVFLFIIHMMNLGLLFSAIALPLFMLWGTGKFRKIAKAEPERVYAVEPANNKARRQADAAPKKSLHEKAMMQARLGEEAPEQESPEAEEEVEVSESEMPEEDTDISREEK